MGKNRRKVRANISRDIVRRLLIECGFKCSVPQCSVQWPTLHQHHIDENPSNNDMSNILMLCPTHHQMVTSKHIDRKTCEMLKELLSTFSQYVPSPDSQANNMLLCSLVSELVMNMLLLSDDRFHQLVSSEKLTPLVYPRLLRTALDQAIASGIFIRNQDGRLFDLLYSWSDILNDFNHRLNLTEYRLFSPLSTSKEVRAFQERIVGGQLVKSAFKKCMDLFIYLAEDYNMYETMKEMLSDVEVPSPDTWSGRERRMIRIIDWFKSGAK
jgi:hypothetical protein